MKILKNKTIVEKVVNAKNLKMNLLVADVTIRDICIAYDFEYQSFYRVANGAGKKIPSDYLEVLQKLESNPVEFGKDVRAKANVSNLINNYKAEA